MSWVVVQAMAAVFSSLTLMAQTQDGVEGCGRVYTSESGVVQSFPYPGPYFPDQNCVWKLQPFRPGEKGLIELTFLDFVLESAPSCRYDFLRVNYTTPSRGHRWYCYWGEHPTPFTTTLLGNVILQFQSDTYQNFRGFTAKFQTYKGIDHVCTFDENMCGWTNTHGDHMDWTWFTGSTPSENTGPKADHTSQLGYYLYVEASEQHYEGEKAWLLSPTFKSRRSNCLWFHYHMFGLHVGSLNVYVNDKLVWKLVGSYGSSWHKAQVPLPARRGKTFKVMFEAVGGYSYEGDIAIDDVVLLQYSSCQHIPWIAAPTTQPPTGIITDTISPTTEFTETQTLATQTDIFDMSTSMAPPQDAVCGGELTERMGVFSSYPFPGPYEANMNCVWRIDPFTNDEKGVIRITLIRFQLQDSRQCDKDYLKINYNVPSYKEPRSLCYRGQQWTPLSVILHGNVTVTFHSDNVTSRDQGFTATYQAFTGVAHMCTFDQNLCGWSNIPGDRADWSWNRGSTSTKNTGPSFDHTTSFGYYMFIEASHYRNGGEEAWLESPVFSPGQANCLTFYYHMYGSHIGTLRVFVGQYLVWTMTGTRSDIWHKGEVPLPSMRDSFRIKFEGVGAGGTEGDMAIDDVMLWEGKGCQYRPARSRVTIDPIIPTARTSTTREPTKPPKKETAVNVDSSYTEPRSLTSRFSSQNNIVICVSAILAILLILVVLVFIWYCWFAGKRRSENMEVTMYPHMTPGEEYDPRIQEEHQYVEIGKPKGFQ